MARTPPNLMELNWKRMDEVSRWHWVKHWCVRDAEAYHERTEKSSAPLLSLVYNLVVRVPADCYLEPFWSRIMAPIRRVLDTEGANLILEKVNLGVQWNHFTRDEGCFNHTFWDGTTLEDIFESEFASSDDGAKTKASGRIRVWQGKNKAAGDVLLLEFQRLDGEITRFPAVATGVYEVVTRHLDETLEGTDTEGRAQAYEDFKADTHKLLNNGGPEEIGTANLEEECLRFADLIYRLGGIVNGDESTRMTNVSHLLHTLGPEADPLLAYLALYDDSDAIRELAANSLTVARQPDSYEAAMKATEAPDTGVRKAAVRSLVGYPEPRTYRRLVKMLGTDGDAEVRQAARQTLEEMVAARKASRVFKEYEGFKVLVADQKPFFSPPLVDELEVRGIEVKVADSILRLQEILQDWQPDVAVIDLLRIEVDSDPGLVGLEDTSEVAVANWIYARLGEAVAVVLLLKKGTDNVPDQLRSQRTVMVRKPTTVHRIVRTVESLFVRMED